MGPKKGVIFFQFIWVCFTKCFIYRCFEVSSVFDFSVEMKQTRKNVDHYLSQGDIAAAERYMEERRHIFLANGYKIRKLNQAYFAFHGIYAHDPASVSPIHRELKQIRTESASLKDFLHNVSGMTSYADLIKALKR